MIDWNPHPFVSTGLRCIPTLPWSFQETVARLIGASGQPGTSDDEYKVSVHFAGTFKGERFTLYDYKEDHKIHVGGTDRLDVDALIPELIACLTTTQPIPYKAQMFYDRRGSHSWPVK